MRGRDYVPEKEALATEVVLAGKAMKGKLWIPAGKSLPDALNSGPPFIEFTEFGEQHIYLLAKTHIIAVKAIDIPKSVPLHERRGVAGGDDPYQILGIAPGTPWSAVRQSYFDLAKRYHPDRYGSFDLPSEVLDYLGAKACRINVAFGLIEDAFKQAASTPRAESRAAS